MTSDHTGKRFGRLVVESKSTTVKPNKTHFGWNCRCDCGVLTVVVAGNLLSGSIRSCGCLAQEAREKFAAHKRPDLLGVKTKFLTVTKNLGSSKLPNGRSANMWEVVCVCGVVKSLSTQRLMYHPPQSCGCKGKNSWKDYSKVVVNGYRMLFMPEHPNSQKSGRIAEHTYIMSEILGRPLVKGENVHHRNGDKLDNRPGNLELWNRSQPCGQRVDEKFNFYVDFVLQYKDEYPDEVKRLKDNL